MASGRPQIDQRTVLRVAAVLFGILVLRWLLAGSPDDATAAAAVAGKAAGGSHDQPQPGAAQRLRRAGAETAHERRRQMQRCPRDTHPSTELYLETIHRSIKNFIYAGPQEEAKPGTGNGAPSSTNTSIQFNSWVNDNGYKNGAHTLICYNCIRLLQRALEVVVDEEIPGDVAEAGVFRGGACIFIEAFLTAHGMTQGSCQRDLWVIDSFEAGLDMVRSTFARYNLLKPNVRFLKGFFADSLPTAAFDVLSLLRSEVGFDGDTYESTLDVLENAYHKLARGAFFIIDDWHLENCRRAIHLFREKNNIKDTIFAVRGGGRFADKLKNAYWRKGSGQTETCIFESKLCQAVDI